MQMENLGHLFAEYGYLVIFLGLFIEGEVFLLASSLLAYMAGYPLWSVVAVAIVASCLSDSLWFYAGKRMGEERMLKYGKYVFLPRLRYESIKKFFQENGKKTLFFAKFIYGMGRIIIFVSSVAGARFKMFAVMDFLATTVWSIALCTFAYVSADYYNLSFRHLVQSLRIVLGIVLALFVLQLVAREVYFSVTKKTLLNK